MEALFLLQSKRWYKACSSEEVCEYPQHLHAYSQSPQGTSLGLEIKEEKVHGARVFFCARGSLQPSQAGEPACAASQTAQHSEGQGQRGTVLGCKGFIKEAEWKISANQATPVFTFSTSHDCWELRPCPVRELSFG